MILRTIVLRTLSCDVNFECVMIKYSVLLYTDSILNVSYEFIL
jgi:hypothetical protein